METKHNLLITSLIFFAVAMISVDFVYSATPFFANDALTQNGIEWCQENRMLYEIMGLEEWLKHHNHSIEARVCAHLYNDPLWSYTGSDRIEKLIEKSRQFVQAEIQESVREAKTGKIDIKPAELGDTVLYGSTPDGLITVKLVTDEPVRGKPLLLGITFLKEIGYEEFGFVKNVNYNIIVRQNKTEVLSQMNQYEPEGSVGYATKPLPTSEPVDIEIEFLGIGKFIPFNETKNTTISFHVVPEFETIVLVLGTVISVTVIMTKLNKLPFQFAR